MRFFQKGKRVLERLICSPFTTHSNEFLAFGYQQHNQRRQEHLATLGINLFNKSVFEAGAGIGDHTSFFLDRGCKVVCSEARDNNLKILRYRFPNVTVVKQNLEKPLENDPEGKFEVVYCYGLLYHIKTPAETLAYLSDKCTGILLLETCVSFGNDEEINLVVEDKKSKTQSISGIGCRPTRIWIFNQLKKHFPYVYMPKTQPNHQEFPLDWSEGPLSNLLTRSVFIASRQKISNPLLVESVPMKQERSS